MKYFESFVSKIQNCVLLILFLFTAFGLPHINNLHAKESSNTSFQKAESLYNRKKYSEALRLYEDIIAKDPSFISVYRRIIDCYTALGDSQGAVIFIESRDWEQPVSPAVCYGLGDSR